jgi:hypothetical protein
VYKKETAVRRFFAVTLASVGGCLGWWLGAKIGLFGAVIFGSLGAGLGLYMGRRLQHDYLS